MTNLALLFLLMLVSGCSALLCSRGICGPYNQEKLDESAIEWNKAIGTHKDELIKVNGSFDICSPLTDGGEVCEWRVVQGSRNHRLIYTFDRNHTAQSWSYTGKYGSRKSSVQAQSENIFSEESTQIGLKAGIEAYKNGNYEKALREWKSLALEGNIIAIMLIGTLFEQGKGVPQDFSKAKESYLIAANAGFGYAQGLLANLYLKGQGVLQDYVQALYWLDLAAAQGVKGAEEQKTILLTKMTTEQIAEAQELVSEHNRKNNNEE